MPTYHYLCLDCEARAVAVKGAALATDELWEVVFETAHAMFPEPAALAEARTCPRCHGQNTERTPLGENPICYIRGNGYLDRAGCHRDMNLFKLENDDPYAEMRQPGEVEDMKHRLRRGGQHDPKPVHFVQDAGPRVTAADLPPPG